GAAERLDGQPVGADRLQRLGERDPGLGERRRQLRGLLDECARRRRRRDGLLVARQPRHGGGAHLRAADAGGRHPRGLRPERLRRRRLAGGGRPARARRHATLPGRRPHVRRSDAAGRHEGLLANVTIVGPGPSGGFVTAFPGDLPAPPNASTVNPSTAVAASCWGNGLPIAGADAGTEAIYSTNPPDVIVDVLAYFQ